MTSNKHSLIAIAFSFLLAISCGERQSNELNLDFEKTNSPDNADVSWKLYSNQYYKVSIDSKIAHKGNHSLKIENISMPRYPSGAPTYLYPDSIQKGQIVKLSGFIKTENTSLDSIGLIINLIDSTEIAFKISSDVNLVGTHDWKEYTIELRNKNNPAKLAIGVGLRGEGKIWADDLKLFIDGKQVHSFHPPSRFVASDQELNWLKNNLTTIKTVQAESGFDDLEPLIKMIGDSRIVGLGENTHGTSEVFKMKDRLVEFLSTKMNFTIFSIEVNMPEAYKLNDYVLHGNGDPTSLLKRMGFWNTPEVLNMITWMRKFNENGKGIIQFTGFDMQLYAGALDNINKFSEKHDKLLKSKLDSIYGLFGKLSIRGLNSIQNREEVAILKNKCEKVLLYLSENKANISQIISDSDYNWLVQNANVLVQSAEYAQRTSNGSSDGYRDVCMAKNITWILDNNPNAKIILWAHNGHISKQKGKMGNFLSEKYGDKYYNIGFLSNSGTYTANNSSKNILIEGKPGSFEYSFHKIGIPSFLFDFGQVKENEPLSKWLTYILKYHNIGAFPTDYQFSDGKISTLFNSIIYIDSTHASEIIVNANNPITRLLHK